MQVIYCNIQPFILDQNVSIYNEETNENIPIGKTSLKNLPQFTSDQCKEQNLHNIVLTGMKLYTNQMAKKIKEYSATKYNSYTINVEVK